MIMRMPRVTKPELGERRGQQRARYERKRGSSVIMRATGREKLVSLS